ncbi:hypothetical protein Cgig2_026820 [Carnegiea gigantea]|uniref:Uncharacterized protein n=1 Tax=Carnegiea gigantea TaxID=171969 RepID=A0A9Q1JYV0_9CARY|nr:hypothetical protein Cgig2_026820 [Carnegiea gigantea]
MSNPDYPGKANTIFLIHYIVIVQMTFPLLFAMLDCLGANVPYPQARHIFRDGRYLSLRASSYREDSRNGRDSIRSAALPVRVGAELILEPYYPNRFAHQFGFDQGVPSNLLGFIRALRQQRSVMNLAQAHADLQRRDTRAKEFLASRARVFQSLSALCSMIDIYNLSTIEICWLSSKIEEIFGVVETAIKIKDLVDIDRIKALSD